MAIKSPTISLITAARNEAGTLAELIERSQPFVDEIIIVDDASTDNTDEVLKDHDVIHIKNEINLNQEPSFEKGLKKAKGNIIVTIDSDLEHAPEDIPLMISFLKKNNLDFVIAKRNDIPRKSERAVAQYTNKKFGIADPFNSFRVFYRYVYEQIGWFHKNNYYGVDFNITASKNFKIDNFKITDTPRRHDARIGSLEEIDKKIFDILDYLKKAY